MAVVLSARSVVGRLAVLTTRLNSRVAAFGVPRGVLFTILEARRRTVTRRVRVPNGEATVEVRLGRRQSDMATLIHVFHERCYELPIGDRPSWIIDAGANVGYSTLWFAWRYPTARVIAIEPNAGNVELLERNVASASTVTVIAGALMDFDGPAAVVDPGRGPDAYRVQRFDRSWSGGEVIAEARCVSVDTLRRDYSIDRIDLLKLDIEGAEFDVLSASDTWMNAVEAVVVELHDRFRPGCTRAFVDATRDFDVERFRGEDVFVARGAA